MFVPRSYRLYGNSSIFFPYVLIEEELFARTLNGMPVSDPYVFFRPVVLRPGLNDQLQHVLINNTARNEETRKK